MSTMVQAIRMALHVGESRMGVTDTKITHPTTTLEDLFMRIVREKTGNGDGKASAYTGSPESR